VSFPSRLWGIAPAEIEFDAYNFKVMTSGDNSFNYFPENRISKFSAVQMCAYVWGFGGLGFPCLHHCCWMSATE